MLKHQYLFLAALLAFAVSATVAQDTCACDAQQEGWSINCSNQSQMTAALNELEAEDCDSSCGSEICRVNWHIVQAHHDFCDEDDLPEAVEDEFHEFEDACEQFSCSISRRFDPSLPQCPTPNCSDDDGDEAYDFLVSNNCETSCTGECQQQFYVLRAYHDLCPEGSLSEEAEEGLHDFEEVCQGCNVSDDDDSQTTCTSSTNSSPSTRSSPNSPNSRSNNDDDSDSDSDSSNATTIRASLLVAFVVLAVCL